jgi:hypothetical protein
MVSDNEFAKALKVSAWCWSMVEIAGHEGLRQSVQATGVPRTLDRRADRRGLISSGVALTMFLATALGSSVASAADESDRTDLLGQLG